MTQCMNKFGLEEIRAIRDKWAAMPYDESIAEQKKLAANAMASMYGENWRAKVKVVSPT